MISEKRSPSGEFWKGIIDTKEHKLPSNPHILIHTIALLVLLVSGVYLLLSNQDGICGTILVVSALLLGLVSLYIHSPKQLISFDQFTRQDSFEIEDEAGFIGKEFTKSGTLSRPGTIPPLSDGSHAISVEDFSYAESPYVDTPMSNLSAISPSLFLKNLPDSGEAAEFESSRSPSLDSDSAMGDEMEDSIPLLPSGVEKDNLSSPRVSLKCHIPNRSRKSIPCLGTPPAKRTLHYRKQTGKSKLPPEVEVKRTPNVKDTITSEIIISPPVTPSFIDNIPTTPSSKFRYQSLGVPPSGKFHHHSRSCSPSRNYLISRSRTSEIEISRFPQMPQTPTATLQPNTISSHNSPRVSLTGSRTLHYRNPSVSCPRETLEKPDFEIESDVPLFHRSDSLIDAFDPSDNGITSDAAHFSPRVIGSTLSSISYNTMKQFASEHHSTPLIVEKRSQSTPKLYKDENPTEDHLNLHESAKIHFRRSLSSKRLLTPQLKKDLRQSLLDTELSEGTPLRDVNEISVSEIEHRDAINYWREFPKIKFYRSQTVTLIIRQILNTLVPEIGVTYQHIIEQFLHAEWPISIFLHGGLLRDIMTSKIGNDVDITFTCGHHEMKEICDRQGWKSEIREDIPYWVIGGASSFETKLEGFPLSFNGLAQPHVQDFFANTIYYDCKNNIIIDRYGMGVSAALAHRITLPCYSPSDWVSWRQADFVPGVKMFRFYKFVTRGFDYDIDEARFVQSSIQEYVQNTPEAASKSCYHALVKLARGQNKRSAASEYKEKLRNKVVEIYMRTNEESLESAQEFWNATWEVIVNNAICMGSFEDEPASLNSDYVPPEIIE